MNERCGRAICGGEQRKEGQKDEFCLFLSENKNMQIISQNPLTILDLCGKIVNCIIIALIMGTFAFSQGEVSTTGDFLRLPLCSSTINCHARSTRLWPRHLPCPWVVRLTHEVPDVRVRFFAACATGVSPLPRRRSGIRPTVPTNVFEWSV